MGPLDQSIALYSDGGLYSQDHVGAYLAPPIPPPGDKILLENGFGLLAENGNQFILES
tara:strand:- start:2576 stop:2749 length:174 start_codon:yes stop_codon:yes gene_type:complete